MIGFAGTSVTGLTDEHARVGDDEEGPATEFINQGGTKDCREQVKDLAVHKSRIQWYSRYVWGALRT